MKIIDLSDLHLGGESRWMKKPLLERFQRLKRQIIQRHQPARDFVIVITGDLSYNAKAFGNQAVDLELDELRNNGFPLFIIPGNHDYGDGSDFHSNLVASFKETFYGDPDTKFPIVRQFDDLTLIGLDSTQAKPGTAQCEGRLGQEQIDLLTERLRDPQVAQSKKVLCLHHHALTFKWVEGLTDADALRQAVDGKVDAVLFGHDHVWIELTGLLARWHIPLWFNPGSSTQKEDALPTCKYKVLDLAVHTHVTQELSF